ncbi:MAG: hypothetical protein J6Q95_03895 [Alistipes sp.]|nr:hypothetical protein [Alistipes sp.]
MKKLVLFLLAIVMMVPSFEAEAQSKKLLKLQKKEYKEKMKEYRKGGWELFGSSRSLDVALLSHYEKLNALGEDGRELVGIAANFEAKATGVQWAINDACIKYAQQAGSYVKGRTTADMGGDANRDEAEFNRFYAAYERLVEKEIKGEMSESYSVIRKMKDGKFEIQTYFIVSESAASKARVRAMEDAARETEVAQIYANKVSDFVREGFDEE